MTIFVASVASTSVRPVMDEALAMFASRALVVYSAHTTPTEPAPAVPFWPEAAAIAAEIEMIQPPRSAVIARPRAVSDVAPSTKASVVPVT